MEDHFVAIQNGRIAPTEAMTDVMFHCLDFLREVARWSDAEAAARDRESSDRVEALLARIGALDDPEAAPPPAEAKEEDPPAVADASMMELFRLEAESQTTLLSDGLLALEEDPADIARIEEMMRAAHSLKGAARIVNLDNMVRLTHKMEDHFVAIQNGEHLPTGTTVDVMLECLDFLKKVSGSGQYAGGEYAAVVDGLVESIESLEKPGAPESRTRKPAEKKAKKKADREKATGIGKATGETRSAFVRVSSANLNRMVELAAQCLVESRNQGNTSGRAEAIRTVCQSLFASLSSLKERLLALEADSSLLIAVDEAHSLADQASHRFQQQLESFDDYIRRNSQLTENLYQESIASRMRPFGEGVEAYPRMIRDISRSIGKKVKLIVRGKDTGVDRDVLEKLDAPLSHILRNALDHGLEPPEERIAQGKKEVGTLTIVARHHAGTLCIEVRDDGRGIDLDRLREKIVEKKLTSGELVSNMTEAELLDFLFLPSFSTTSKVTELSGRGVGLDVVQSMMQELGGTVRIETVRGEGSTFQLNLPVTRSVMRALLLTVDEELYAIPISRVARIHIVTKSDMRTVENRIYVTIDGQEVGLLSAHHVLDMGDSTMAAASDATSVVVLNHHSHAYGIIVDRILGETELVARPLDESLGQLPNINAAGIHENGDPILILNVDDLVNSIDNKIGSARWQAATSRDIIREEDKEERRKILVVDDSITVRQMQKQILESSGFEVHLAVDGVEGWNAIRLGDYDLVISDIDMPRMTGFELVSHIRDEARFAQLPVIIVSYKDREEDRRKGLELGANYYLTKSSFQNETYTNAVLDLIGKAKA